MGPGITGLALGRPLHLSEPQCPHSETGQRALCPSFSGGRYQSDTRTFTVTASTCHRTPQARSFRPQRSLWCSELMHRVLGPETSPGSPAGLPRCGPSFPGFLGAPFAPALEMGPGRLSLGPSSHRSLPFSRLRPPPPHLQVTDLQSFPQAGA